VACDTLVRQGGLSERETRVLDDFRDYYGRRYWLEHQTEELGLPDVHARARLDLPERCADWLAALLRYRRPPGEVLEVGAGHGAYSALLGWAGFDSTALDLSPWIADFARTRFGVRYLVGPVEEQSFERESFDVVVANDVLEHLATPLSSVAAWTRALRPGGLFVFQTPDYAPEKTYEELVASDDEFLQHMHRAGEEHLYLFSRRSVTQLLEAFGLGYVVFEDATYVYDMLGLASAEPLLQLEGDATAIIGSTPTAPLAVALLDARDAWTISERDRADRLVVIEKLDAALRNAPTSEPGSPSTALT
jgi:2-polyprenyl-3-methyl-5-hydroxy-6-metoxy-1,4-benzoquinol methylase